MEELGEVARLLVEMHRRENQFDGPFGGQTLGFERIGQPQTTDSQIGSCLAAPRQLQIRYLALPLAHSCTAFIMGGAATSGIGSIAQTSNQVAISRRDTVSVCGARWVLAPQARQTEKNKVQ